MSLIHRLHLLLPKPSLAIDNAEVTLGHFVDLAISLGCVPVVFLRPAIGPFDISYLRENDQQCEPGIRPFGGNDYNGSDCLDDTIFFPIVWQQTIQEWAQTAQAVTATNVDWDIQRQRNIRPAIARNPNRFLYQLYDEIFGALAGNRLYGAIVCVNPQPNQLQQVVMV